MNSYQELWWQQAESDHAVFVLLREQGVAQCHTLHYLQMTTEKIAKAFLWRLGKPPRSTHVGFTAFIKGLANTPQKERKRIANLFGFKHFDGFQSRLHSLATISYDLERTAPALANDGPNPEYPWPHQQPKNAPVNHKFSVWASLESSRGRELMKIIGIAVKRFPEYADT